MGMVVTMNLVIEKEAVEGLFKGIPEGTHDVSFPLSNLGFYDWHDQVLGGNFTADNEQLITNGTTIDGVTYSNIFITQES